MSTRRPSAPASVAAAALAACNAFVGTNVAGRVIASWTQVGAQLQRGEVLASLRSIATHGLRADLSSGLAYQVLMNGPRLGLYDPMQPLLRRAGLFDEESKWRNKYASAAVTGALGGTLGLPVHTVRVDEHLSTSLARGLVQVARARGAAHLFPSLGAVVPRFAVMTMAQLPTYELAKEALGGRGAGLPDGSVLLSLPAAVASSTFTVLCVHPIDVVAGSRRVVAAAAPPPPAPALAAAASGGAAAPGSTGSGGGSSSTTSSSGTGRRQGFAARALEIVRAEGLRGLQRGYAGHYYRLGLHIFFTTITLDQLKQACAGVPALSVAARDG